MYCDVRTNLKRDRRGLRARVDEELTRSFTAAAIGGFNPLFTVLGDHPAQYPNYDQYCIGGEADRGHAHI
jgi:hypothetical protein